MKDYSNYRPSTHDKLYWSNKQVFDNELKYKGDDVLIDNIFVRALIKEHTSPFNEKKEERKFMCHLDCNVNRGSVVDYNNGQWLVISDIDSNKVHKSCKILQCNNKLKFYDLTSISNSIVSIPCIKENKSIGIDNNNYFIDVKGKITVKVPVTDNTLLFYDGQRFIVDIYVYEVTEIKCVNLDLNKMSGYLEIEMSKVQKDLKDNFETGIAYNEKTVLNNYSIEILNGQDLSLNVSESATLNIQVKNNGEIVNPIPELEYINSNPLVSSIENNIITAISQGSSIITVRFKNEPIISKSINITVSEIKEDNKTVVLNGNTKLYKNKSNTYSCLFKNNGIEYVDNGIFYLTADDGISELDSNIAVINSQGNNQCIVSAKNPNGIVYVKLFCKSEDGLVISEPLRIKICSVV